MAIVQMQKVAVVGMNSQKEDIIQSLHEEGVLEVVEATGDVQVDHTDVNFRKADVQFVIDTLKDVASKETIAVAGKNVDADTIIETVHHLDVRGMVDELRALEESDTNAERDIQEAHTLELQLQPWLAVPFTLSDAHSSASSLRMTGTLPAPALPAVHDILKNDVQRAEIIELGTEAGLSHLVVHVWKEDATKLEELLTSLGWSSVELPALDGTPATLHEEAMLTQKKLQKQKEENHKKREQLSIELPKFVQVAQFMNWLDQKQAVREASSQTDATFTLLGWMPKSSVELLESRLQKVSPAIAVMKVKPDEGEEAPVLLKNSKIVTPFQSVTSLYGLPLAHEGDPTAALSPFFIFYFALCLTDAGYGAAIAIIFGIACLKLKQTVEEAPLLWCLFFSGIMAFLVGIPFGGWFGLTPAQVPEWLTKADGTLFKGQIWNLSTQDGVSFLQNLALVLGITHLSFGMFLAGLHKWMHGKKMEAIWVDFTSHLLIAGGIFMAAAPESMAGTAKTTMLVIVALAVWGKGHGSAWYLRPIFGVLGLVNFGIGMLSNSLSYLRILALGLVTGALAMAVNQVAVELGKLFPIFIAIPVIIVICLVGHLVSIALNTLGSFIHSARLQFIEFFSQFFEGGGRGYSPFKRTTL